MTTLRDALTLIGESINDSVPSTNKLYAAGDIEGIKALAQKQDEAGAAYIDVNVGSRDAAFLAEMVRTVQTVTQKPLSIDTPDPAMAEEGLKAYDASIAGGAAPLLNSISQLRLEMFDLLKIQPFRPILLISERVEDGVSQPNHTAEETYATAQAMRDAAHAVGLSNDDIIFDPAISPIGADSEGDLHRLMGAMTAIHNDPDMAGVHASVGLSNFTVMLPPKREDGMPVKSALESAFLTRAMPLGVDMVIGSVKRKYRRLEDDHPALQCFDEVLTLEGFDTIMRVQDFYSN